MATSPNIFQDPNTGQLSYIGPDGTPVAFNFSDQDYRYSNGGATTEVLNPLTGQWEPSAMVNTVNSSGGTGIGVPLSIAQSSGLSYNMAPGLDTGTGGVLSSIAGGVGDMYKSGALTPILLAAGAAYGPSLMSSLGVSTPTTGIPALDQAMQSLTSGFQAGTQAGTAGGTQLASNLGATDISSGFELGTSTLGNAGTGLALPAATTIPDLSTILAGGGLSGAALSGGADTLGTGLQTLNNPALGLNATGSAVNTFDQGLGGTLSNILGTPSSTDLSNITTNAATAAGLAGGTNAMGSFLGGNGGTTTLANSGIGSTGGLPSNLLSQLGNGLNSVLGTSLGSGGASVGSTLPGLLALAYAAQQPGADTSQLQSILSGLQGNQNAVIQAAQAPAQQNLAAGYGNLLQSQALRGVRGSSFGDTDIANFLATGNTALANAGANAAQGSLALQGNLASQISQMGLQNQQIKNNLYGTAFNVLGRGLNPSAYSGLGLNPSAYSGLGNLLSGG